MEEGLDWQRTRIEATTRYIWVERRALVEGNEAKWEEERVWKTTAHSDSPMPA